MRGAPSGIGQALVRVRAKSSLLPLDVLLVAFTYAFVLVVRSNGHVLSRQWHAFEFFLPIAIVVHIAANWLAGLYGRVWRYASLVEVRRVFVAGFGAGVVLFALNFSTARRMPPSLVILGAIVVSLFLGSMRLFRPVSERSATRARARLRGGRGSRGRRHVLR